MLKRRHVPFIILLSLITLLLIRQITSFRPSGLTASAALEPVATLIPLPIAPTSHGLQNEWLSLTTTNTGPGARYDHNLLYDATHHKLYLFGGRDNNQSYNDVWTLDLSESLTLTWQAVATASVSQPSQRHSAVAMLDEAGENLYVTVGQTQSGATLNDVWRLNLTTQSWTDLTDITGTNPTDRYAGVGGSLDGNLVISHGFGSQGRQDDTWRFDIETETWEEITPASGALPIGRCLLDGVTAGDKLIFHGGCGTPNASCYLDDTWILNTTTQRWQEVISNPKPAGRRLQSLAHLADTDALILWGGYTESSGSSGTDDLWLFDLKTLIWEEIALTALASGPSARHSHQATGVAANALQHYNEGMIMYGGKSGSNVLGDLWFFHFIPQTVQFTTATATISETTDTAVFTITRTGGYSETFTVDYQTESQTALPNQDYVSLSGTLVFTAGLTEPQTIVLTLLDDALYEAQESLTITLKNVTAGFSPGYPASVAVTILSDDPPVGQIYLPLLRKTN